MASAGAQAALRGYRLQALYTLFRLMEGTDGQVFHLEGREDLDVFGADGQALEFVQVKAHDGNLTLSDLDPKNSRSLFRRILARRKLYPSAQERILSFSPFGSQMDRAWASDGEERAATIQQLVAAGYTAADAGILLSRVKLQEVDHAELEAKVYGKLGETAAGVDPSAAFDLLHAWLYVASENRLHVTPLDLMQRILAVGKFVSDRGAHSDEWYRSIVPLFQVGEPCHSDDLRVEFYSGVSARYEHIAAGVDVARNGPLESIEKAFAGHRLVVVHGASGQGKSALAYRYLHDFVPPGWRYQVRLVESRLHALKIAQALLGHLQAVGSPAYVYVDVEPGENLWLELVKGLASFPLVRILVTIREEDWRRTVSPGAAMPLAEVELRFDRTEASHMYDELLTFGVPSHLLSFDDAWTRFGEHGPLLEFAHFVARNETLQTRLSNQVLRLIDERREGKLLSDEIELLRRAAVANAYGARLNLELVGGALNLPDPARTLSLFEREYLVRIAPNGRHVEGLHPIRSEILARLLTDDVFEPWGTVAARSLPAIVDEDLETFLLHAFARHPEAADELEAAIGSTTPRTWTAVAGTVRALLWRSVRTCLSDNESLIREIQSKFDSAWPYVLMADLGNVNAVTPGLVRPLFEDAEWIPDERRHELAGLRARMTRSDVMASAKLWLSEAPLPVSAPHDSQNWRALAEAAFWIQHLGLPDAIATRLPISALARAVNDLPLEVASEVAYGFSFLSIDAAKEALAQVRVPLLDRFQTETGTPTIEDDGRTIRTHFMFEPRMLEDGAADENEGTKRNAVHHEAMRRVNLIRQIVPEREFFGCQGYGHKLDILPVEGDDSTKTGIAAAQLPPQWPLQLNISFMRMGQFLFRMDHWDAYAKAIAAKRVVATNALEELGGVLAAYFHDRRHPDVLDNNTFTAGWANAAASIRAAVAFPKDAVDEWGRTSESADIEDLRSKSAAAGDSTKGVAISLVRLRGYSKACSEYLTHLSNFFEQAPDTLEAMPLVGRLRSESERRAARKQIDKLGQPSHAGRLPSINLFDAWRALPVFQTEFRKHFAQYFGCGELEQLDRNELSLLRTTFCIWFQFVSAPESIMPHLLSDAERLLTTALGDVRRRLRGRLKRFAGSGTRVSIHDEGVHWDQKPALWLTMDMSDPRSLFEQLGGAYDAIAGSMPKVSAYDLRYYAVFSAWETVHLIPLVRGRPLGKCGWRFSALSLTGYERDSNIPWWHLALQSLPDDVFEALGISPFNWPSLELFDKLIAAATQLSFLVASTNALNAMPTPTGIGNELLKTREQARSTEISSTFSEVISAMGAVARFIESSVSVDEVDENVLELANTVGQALPELYHALLPDNLQEETAVLDTAEMTAWGQRLGESLPMLQVMRLHWLAYVVSQLA